MKIKQFIYLFLIDLVRYPLEHTYLTYQKTEPGYGCAMLEAYNFALASKKPGRSNLLYSLICVAYLNSLSLGRMGLINRLQSTRKTSQKSNLELDCRAYERHCCRDYHH